MLGTAFSLLLALVLALLIVQSLSFGTAHIIQNALLAAVVGACICNANVRRPSALLVCLGIEALFVAFLIGYFHMLGSSPEIDLIFQYLVTGKSSEAATMFLEFEQRLFRWPTWRQLLRDTQLWLSLSVLICIYAARFLVLVRRE